MKTEVWDKLDSWEKIMSWGHVEDKINIPKRNRAVNIQVVELIIFIN